MTRNDRVLVDSSVWIAFFRGNAKTVKALTDLIRSDRIVISGQVRQEVLQGSRDDTAFAQLEKQMAIWHSVTEQPQDFVDAARIFARLRWKGITIPPSDCLIAATAIRAKLRIYTHDEDFDHIPGLDKYLPEQTP